MGEEGERIRRLCGMEVETWEHPWEGCRRWERGKKHSRKR